MVGGMVESGAREKLQAIKVKNNKTKLRENHQGDGEPLSDGDEEEEPSDGTKEEIPSSIDYEENPIRGDKEQLDEI